MDIYYIYYKNSVYIMEAYYGLICMKKYIMCKTMKNIRSRRQIFFPYKTGALFLLQFEVQTANVGMNRDAELFKPLGLRALIILNTMIASVQRNKEF